MTSSDVEHALAVRDVHVDIAQRSILRGVTLTVAPGDVVGLMGPNGAGKSTLLDVVAGRRLPRSGQVSVLGSDVTRQTARQRARRGLGVVLQGGRVFDHLTVGQHLRLGSLARGGPAASVTGLVEAITGELDEDTRVAALSHSARLEIELAMVVASGAAMLILDEPTAGLDRAERTRTAQHIRAVRDAIPHLGMLIIEHDKHFLDAVADRGVILEGGCIVASGGAR